MFGNVRGQEGLTGSRFGPMRSANSDLPMRLQIGAVLNEPDPTTFYGGGAAGCTSCPATLLNGRWSFACSPFALGISTVAFRAKRSLNGGDAARALGCRRQRRQPAPRDAFHRRHEGRRGHRMNVQAPKRSFAGIGLGCRSGRQRRRRRLEGRQQAANQVPTLP